MYWDVYRVLSAAGLSVYTDERHLNDPSSALNKDWAFGARVIQYINNKVETLIPSIVSTAFDQYVAGTKTFLTAPKINDTSSISTNDSIVNVDYLNGVVTNTENSFVFSNSTSSITGESYANPTSGSKDVYII